MLADFDTNGPFSWPDDWGWEQIYPTIPAGKYDPGASIANFDARMEIAVSTAASIEGVELQIMYPNENNTELTVNAPLSDFVRSTDGKWYTISVPLSNLANGNTKLSTYGDLLKPNADGQHHFRVVIVNPTVDPVPVVMGIDNIRIVNAIIQ